VYYDQAKGEMYCLPLSRDLGKKSEKKEKGDRVVIPITIEVGRKKKTKYTREMA